MEDRYYWMALKAENSLCGDNERFQGTGHSACGHNRDGLQGSGEQAQIRLRWRQWYFSSYLTNSYGTPIVFPAL